MSIWRRLKNRIKRENRKVVPPVADDFTAKYQGETVSAHVEETIAFLEKWLGENDDFAVRRFRVFGQYSAALINFSQLVDESSVDDNILKSLMHLPRQLEKEKVEKGKLKQLLLNDTLYHSECEVENNLTTIVEEMLRGKTLLIVDGMREGILLKTRSIDKRNVSEPETERVIRGSREGFIEVLGTNIGLIRYRLPSVHFRVKTMKVGRVTKSKVALCYLDHIAKPKLVEEVERRLSAIDIDAVMESGYIEQFIEDHHFTPFPQVMYSERPDTTVANILEGRVAILVDGTPFALIVPAVFHQFYQTVDDYSERFLIGNLVRFIRLLAILFSLNFSALYVALISFNPELIPTDFAVAVAGGRAGVPYPPVVEVLIMETAMEILREASIRLPQQVGGALSIVGVLIIGDAAVTAGLASPITIVVVALTTIGSFATPKYNMAITSRMLRFPLIILAGIFGLYGLMIGLIFIVNHLLSLRSFGVPYFSPIVPINWQGWKDTMIRGPLWSMKKRPEIFHPRDDKRVGRRANRIGKAPSNTLDPLKVGNERWDPEGGVSTPDHRDTNDRDSD